LQYGTIGSNRHYESQSINGYEYAERKIRSFSKKYLKQIDGASNLNMNKFREDRKDDRTKIQAGQQSKLIDQRSKDKEPLDFENDFNFEEMMG
jgi:hypothetical protein